MNAVKVNYNNEFSAHWSLQVQYTTPIVWVWRFAVNIFNKMFSMSNLPKFRPAKLSAIQYICNKQAPWPAGSCVVVLLGVCKGSEDQTKLNTRLHVHDYTKDRAHEPLEHS